jgi:phosphate transport system protein
MMDDVPSTELRRTYHDRIAALHDRTAAMVQNAATATEDVTAAFLSGDREAGAAIAASAATAAGVVGAVDADVLDLLALQSPVARDLRMILAARDIGHSAELCLGLCRRSAARAGGAQDVLSDELRGTISQMGESTVDLLRRAAAAWTALDGEQADTVLRQAPASRQLQRRFLSGMLDLRLIAVDAAVDLSTTSRMYERLTDHAEEMAGHVLFVITGTAPAELVVGPA